MIKPNINAVYFCDGDIVFKLGKLFEYIKGKRHCSMMLEAVDQYHQNTVRGISLFKHRGLMKTLDNYYSKLETRLNGGVT